MFLKLETVDKEVSYFTVKNNIQVKKVDNIEKFMDNKPTLTEQNMVYGYVHDNPLEGRIYYFQNENNEPCNVISNGNAFLLNNEGNTIDILYRPHT